MSLAHNCHHCGLNLTGLRAPPDPHYRLAVVVCPRCTVACVRTRPESVAIWRRFRFVHSRWVCLVMQLIATALFLGTNTAAARAITWGYIDEFWVRMVFAGCTVLCTGMWLGSCFGHAARWRVFASWTALLAMVVLVEACVTIASGQGVSRGTVSWRESARFFAAVGGELGTYEGYIAVLILLTFVVFACTPLGVVLRWVNRSLDRAEYRRRKKSFRRLRDDR